MQNKKFLFSILFFTYLFAFLSKFWGLKIKKTGIVICIVYNIFGEMFPQAVMNLLGLLL
jgi:hypothetical protein